MSERGINRPSDFKSLIESLIKSKDSSLEEAPFETYAEIMTFAATVGVRLCPDDFKDNYKFYGDPIKFSIFEHSGFDFIIHILAVYKERNLNILTSSKEDQKDKKISIFEGYAYAGLKKVKSIVDQPGMTLDNLIDFIKEELEENNTSNDTILSELF